ncbi:MAG: sugar transferase [Frisingicoccus sp.]|uniref:sugar transferase n=1 Tax=Frisingicoccus sp. TaxID=1918627 RepID=UPI0026255682|nr:sugar transferase [Frisingicoccus sp.]MDD6231646.1 sugar transferase [Frisingicoccus sp.]
MLRRWEDLPKRMQNEAVRPYYEQLQKKKVSLFLKRCIDVSLSSALLLFLAPVMLLIGIAVRLDSPGPALFRQVRVTQYGRQFRIFKFRTMVNHADRMGTQVTASGDARITRLGRKLRHYRLDELPQLLNIFLGDMSFVGTRPEVVKYVREYTDEMTATLLLPAGVTSEVSIQYKDEEKLLADVADVDEAYIHIVLPEKMEYNLKSLKDFSLIHELKIMVDTVIAVFR